MEKIKLKFGGLVIAKQDKQWILMDRYTADGSFAYRRESDNLDEIAIGFADLMSLRIRDWVTRTLEKEEQDCDHDNKNGT